MEDIQKTTSEKSIGTIRYEGQDNSSNLMIMSFGKTLENEVSWSSKGY